MLHGECQNCGRTSFLDDDHECPKCISSKDKTKWNIAKWCYESIIKEPQNWVQLRYTLIHNSKGIELWTNNGRFELGIYSPQKISFSFYWKLKIWKVYKKRWKRMIIEDLK